MQYLRPPPGLPQAVQGLVMQLRDARRGDREEFGHIPQGDILQVMKHDHGDLRLGQFVQAREQRAPIFGSKNAGVRSGRVGIGKPFGQREAFLSMDIFGYFIKGDELPWLGHGLKSCESGDFHAERRSQFRNCGFTFKFFDEA